MKLAEALQERADLNQRITALKSRLINNALVQEGEEPNEEPKELLSELNDCIDRLEKLIARINLTNCETKIDGESLTILLARKDAMTLRLGAYRDLAGAAGQNSRRATRSEIKLLSTVNVRNIQREADSIAKALRELDNSIQAANWSTELI